MRKIILSLTSLLILLPAIAQKRWSVIPQAGLQISNIKNNQDIETKPIVGYRAGAIGEYQFSQGILGNIAVQSGLFISSKGVKDNPHYIVKSHYLEVPLLLRLGIHLTQAIDIHLKAGPYFGYWIAGHSESYAPDGVSKSHKEPFYCPYDSGIEMGIGATYRHLVFNIGGNLGMYDFYIDKNIGEYFNLKNQTLHFTLGYKF